MCIISYPIKSVFNTQILVAPDRNRKNQLIVYSNSVNNESKDNVMILPVPYPDTLEFYNLKEYKEIFADCAKSFYEEQMRGIGSSIPLGRGIPRVFQVGNYEVTVVNNLEDIDKSKYNIMNECYDMLKKEYSNGPFGFILCKLRDGEEEYHPIAYSHKIYDDNKLFIPTKHFHPHNLSDTKHKEDKRADWDHVIYLVNCVRKRDLKNISYKDEIWDQTCSIDRKRLTFDFGTIKNMNKCKIHGLYRNIDVFAKNIRDN